MNAPNGRANRLSGRSNRVRPRSSFSARVSVGYLDRNHSRLMSVHMQKFELETYLMLASGPTTFSSYLVAER
jgi:hypothetical protein